MPNLENTQKLINAGFSADKIDSIAGLYAPYGEANAIIVSDYPFGFRERVCRKVWLEFDKNKGTRFCVRTSNKGNALSWCKEKKSSYTDSIIAVKIDDAGHYDRIDVVKGVLSGGNWQDSANDYKYDTDAMTDALDNAIGLGVVTDEILTWFQGYIDAAKRYNQKKVKISVTVTEHAMTA